ncbi:MAG: acyltransferase family protein [Hyphomonas sp.]
MISQPFAQNRFDLIRLLLASGVFAYHALALSAVAPGSSLELTLATLAEVSIQGFFIVSGALVAGSWDRSSTLADYAGKRFRRLYPAYAVIILLPALISVSLTWDGPSVLRYLGANLVFLNFLEPNLPGLFGSNRFTEVNGALWTLKIEVMFYIILPLILLVLKAMRAQWWLVIAALYIAGSLWAVLVPQIGDTSFGLALSRQLPGQMAFFAMGITLWKCAGQLPRHWAKLGLLGAILTAASLASPLLEPLRALGLAGIISAIAFAPGPALSAARFGDISYGLYITHFPILQAMLATGLLRMLGAPAFFVLSAILVLAASFALWHLVEKPALRPTSHYRKVAAGNDP